MTYRILGNQDGKFKVQSRPHRFARWRNRGYPIHANFRILNWGATEFDSLEKANTCVLECKEYHAKVKRERQWSLVALYE